MPQLAAAYHGYNHQDVVTAYSMASLLLPRPIVHEISVDRKVTADDRFDDLQLLGSVRRRTQVKAHTSPDRQLGLADLTTNAIDFRIDRAIRSITNDPSPADIYTLFTTYSPDNDLVPFLQPDRSTPPLLTGVDTKRFRLCLERIWPENESPTWRALDGLERDVFANFCSLFVVEVGCPTSSGDLRMPGPLEQALLALLRDGIGVGLFPNNNRDVADAAAHLIYAAQAARKASQTIIEKDVIRVLALKIDYGRVTEQFPINVDHLVQRTDMLDQIVQMLLRSPRVAITGTPGVGKSWLVQQLRSRLLAEGWIVAAHFCFVDIFDNDRDLRASVATTFGSIIAELYDCDHSLLSDAVPRFAARPSDLEQILRNAARADPLRRIAVIIDGLDHVDRLPGGSRRNTAAEIVEELAILEIPSGVTFIVVSQPGEHLSAFLSCGSEYAFSRWPDERIREIVQRTELETELRTRALENEVERVTSSIVDKASGNPLYATYLVRTALEIVRQQAEAPTADLAEHLRLAPPFDSSLSGYYAWLVEGLDKDTGVIWIAAMLALLDFAVTSDELKEIRPDFKTYLDRVLTRLAPVLADHVVHGGVRIYHESFQRYMHGRLDADSTTDIASILAPVIKWLDGRGFLTDVRAFRSLFTLLKKAGRESELLQRTTNDFVALSAANAQAGQALMANVAAAADVAAAMRDWASLGRLLEVSRACDYLYQWRFNVEHDIAEAYGRAYSELYGAKSLSDRLLYDGRCTFLPRPGLLLCQLCDFSGAIPPWQEYIFAQKEASRSDNSNYGAEADRAIASARLTGHLRLQGRDKSIQDCAAWLSSSDRLPLPHYDVAVALGGMYGFDALLTVVESLPPGTARAWTRLGLAKLSETLQEAKLHAEAAVRDGLPLEGWRRCLDAGIDPGLLPRQAVDIRALTDEVLSESIQFNAERLRLWLTEIRLMTCAEGDDALREIELRIIPDSWFHKWLSFCLALARRSLNPRELVEGLTRLGENIEVFKGKPRACDLYSLHDEIRASFYDVLARLHDEHWVQAIRALSSVSSGTTTWVTGSRTGPLPIDAMFDLLLETADTPAKRSATSVLAADLLGPERRSGEFYDTHARDSLLLVRIHMDSDQRQLAEAAWRDACTYLMSYGWRKDITVYEVLDPLEMLGKADPVRTRQCIARMQPIVESVLVHTDGRETRHAIHKWINLAAKIHPAGALSFLANSEIANLPEFGDLDHALPKALAVLSGQIKPLTLASGWLAAGYEAQYEPEAAIKACEDAIGESGTGNAIWQSVVASLEGDGVEPPAGLADLAAASTRRMGVPELVVKNKETPTNDDRFSGSNLQDDRELSERLQPTFFTVPRAPLQIISAVRKWRDARLGRAPVDSVLNAVGWRILEFIEGGDEASAEMVIRHLARDVSSTDREGLLAGLAEGIKIRGHVKLAALASTLAYTSGRDGWLHFGGPTELILDAIQLDPNLAWSTLAEEIGGIIARGGCAFTTKRLVEVLIAAGQIDQAFLCWSQACDVIAARLPRTGPSDDLDLGYDHTCEDPSSMLVAAIMARTNHLFIHEKRSAAAAAAIIARHDGGLYASGLRFAVTGDVPPWTLITLLHLLFEFEVAPYEATHAAASTLQLVATGKLVSARVLARALLERAGLPAPIPPPEELPISPKISEQRASEIAGLMGPGRLRRVNRLWPQFAQNAIEQMDVVYRSDDLRRRMGRTLDRFRLRREGRQLQVWYPLNEEVESVLQATGASVRGVLAKEGIIEPSVEEAIGMELLCDTEMMVRIALSRVVRPTYATLIASKSLGTHIGEPIILERGAYEGWIVAGFHEVQAKISGLSAVDGRLVLFSGVVFDDTLADDELPFGNGDPHVWIGICQEAPPGPLRGPLAGLQRIRDPFGRTAVLVPNPVIVATGKLTVAPFEEGLTLVDQDSRPAAVCRAWRQRLIGSEYADDREHRIEGIELLVRPDLFTAVSSLALSPPRLVTLVSEIKNGDDE